MINKKFIPKEFILDVDGVMTTGNFIYSEKGKVMKIFGLLIQEPNWTLLAKLKFSLTTTI